MTRRLGGALGSASMLAAALVQACGGSPTQPTPPAPPAQNDPPVIASITATPARLEVTTSSCAGSPSCPTKTTLTAAVQDAETPVANLTYEWSETVSPAVGRFEGTGATVTWTAPASVQAPVTVELQLTVVEKYASRVGGPVDAEHRASKTVSVRVHDSVKEVGNLAVQFLKDFSVQLTPPEAVVRNFSGRTSCRRTDELNDVVKNQTCYRITSYLQGPASPVVTIAYGAADACGYPGRPDRPGDACAVVSMTWNSRIVSNDGVCASETGGLPVGTNITASGKDYVAAVYEQNQWWLCSSDWLQQPGSPVKAFKR